MTGKSFTRLSKIFASALLGAGLVATCAAASPGSSATSRAVAATTAAITGVTLTNPGNQVAKVLPETVSLQLSATDAAGGALTYTATGLPPGTSIDPATGLISGTVTDYYDGTASVTATDASGASATVSFNWLAENAIYLATEPTLQTRPDVAPTLQIHAVDPEQSEALTYAAAGLPPGLSIDPTTGLISGTETATIGSYDVSVTVSDSTGSSESISFTWRIWNAITVSTTLEETSTAGQPVSVPVTATDSAAGQTFKFSATGLPPGLSIDPTSGVITGSATAEGQFKATITATDSTGSQGSTTDYWYLAGQAEITSPGTVVTTAGQLAQIPLTVGDTASNAVPYYSIVGGPPGAYVNWNSATADGWRTATLTGWPAPAGSYKTTISLMGDNNNPASVTFTWTVKPAAGTGPTGPVRLGEEGKCLDDTGNSSANGNKVQIWACNGDAAQNWTYAEDGTLRIHGKCLDDTGYGTKVGTKLQLWSCLSHTNQMWTTVNTVNLDNALAHDCLSVPNAGNGVQVELGDCYPGDPQDEWTLPAGEILSGVPGECITDSGGGTANGTEIVLGTCTDSSAQRWTAEPDNTIRIFGKCLSLATPASGSDAILWSCGAGHMQQWSLDGSGVALGAAIEADGNVPGNDIYLESPPGQTAAGTQLVLGPYGGSNADWDIWDIW